MLFIFLSLSVGGSRRYWLFLTRLMKFLKLGFTIGLVVRNLKINKKVSALLYGHVSVHDLK